MVDVRHSWGRYFHYTHDERVLFWRNEHLPSTDNKMLPHGLGRSYGDSCLNDGGTLVHTHALNHFIQLDKKNGLLRCEAGVSLADILAVCVPQGWFLPVTPGTKFVTIGGAVANDVHGKNHVADGTFGRHVSALELLRSNGERLLCNSSENAALFCATIGGLGLTGFITWVEVQLIPVSNVLVSDDSFQCDNLDHCLQHFEQSRETHRYRVAWLDCLAKGNSLGRGIFSRANHCDNGTLPAQHQLQKTLSVPLTFPPHVLNHYSVKAFNAAYFRKLRGRKNQRA